MNSIQDLFINCKIKRNYYSLNKDDMFLNSMNTCDPNLLFYSIIVKNNNHFNEEDYDNPILFNKEENSICSLFDEKINKYIWDNNNIITERINHYLEKKGIKQENKDFYIHFDSHLEQMKRLIKIVKKKEVILDYIYFAILDSNIYTEEELDIMDVDQYKRVLFDYYNNNHDKYYPLIFNERTEYSYERNPISSELINNIAPYYQIFAIKDIKENVVHTYYIYEYYGNEKKEFNRLSSIFSNIQDKKRINSYFIDIQRSSYEILKFKDELVLISTDSDLGNDKIVRVFNKDFIKKGEISLP